MSVTRPEASFFAGGWATSPLGFGPATFPPPPSSSGRGLRLSAEGPIGFAPAPGDDRKAGGVVLADLEPCRETPRTLTPPPEGHGGPLAPVLAGGTFDGEADGDETGAGWEDAGEMGDAGVPVESGGFDVKPGVDTGCG